MSANRDFTHPFSGIEAERLYPGDIKRGENSRKARQIQEWLNYHGAVVDVDNDFGKGTEAALARFQATMKLPSTGALNTSTWDALIDPLNVIMRPVPQGTDLRAAILAYAWQNESVHPIEIGGPNCGPFVRSYMLGGDGKWAQWCAGFACFVLAQAHRALGIDHLPFTPSFGVPEIARSAQAKGIFMADGPATAGDVFVIPTAHDSWCHIGIVARWNTPKFASVEGNTNDQGGSDGTCARSWDRTVDRCDFIKVC